MRTSRTCVRLKSAKGSDTLLYLLDTDICIYTRRNKPVEVARRLQATQQGDLGMSVITYGELAYGAAKSAGDRASADLQRIIKRVPVLPLPERAGEIYGELQAVLGLRGTLIGPNDLWIAAHAIASGLTLVTNNEREFRRIEGLKIENWAK